MRSLRTENGCLVSSISVTRSGSLLFADLNLALQVCLHASHDVHAGRTSVSCMQILNVY